MTPADIRATLADLNEEAQLLAHPDDATSADDWDGASVYDEALVGIVQRFNDVVALYDYEKLVEIHVREGMDDEGAREWLDFNTVGAWVGDGTPCYLRAKVDSTGGENEARAASNSAATLRRVGAVDRARVGD